MLKKEKKKVTVTIENQRKMKQRHFLLLLAVAEIPVGFRQAEPTISFIKIRHRLNLNEVNQFDRISQSNIES